MIKTIIVEDDPHHARNLKELLESSVVPVAVLSVCTNVSDSFAAINKLKPELVFLDIDLDMGESGFDLLMKFDKPDFTVIFATQNNTAGNAIAAMRACAFDFLPKPLLPSELEAALTRFNKNRAAGAEQIKLLQKNTKSADGKKGILIKSTDGQTLIEEDNIIYCLSHNSSTEFFLAAPVQHHSTHMSSVSIKDWENILSDSSIFRSHNRYLVNLKYIEKYKSRLAGGATLTLKDRTELPVSKNRKEKAKERLNLFQKTAL